MRILPIPGVFAPHSDTWLLASHLQGLPQIRGAVVDVCTGSGALAITAARAGAASVTAIDVSRRAVIGAQLNARLNGVRVRGRLGSLLSAVPGERFDVIVSNPPYLPSSGQLPSRGSARHIAGGADGRVLLDRLIAQAPSHLRPGGLLVVTHSSINDERATIERIRAAGLQPEVLERRRGPLGPLLTGRASELEARGLLADGVREEELLIVAGTA